MNLRDELLMVRAKHGALTPAAVLEDATPKSHPLHSGFEWDNRIAGHKYRLQQAHDLIVSVRVSLPTGDPAERRSVRAFQAVRGEDVHSYVYDPAEEVAVDPFRRELVLREMEREWRVLHARYSMFAEFVEMVRRDVEAA